MRDRQKKHRRAAPCGRGKFPPPLPPSPDFTGVRVASSGREVRKEEILRPADKPAFLRISPRLPRMSPGTIEDEGAHAPPNHLRDGNGRFAAEGFGPPDLPEIAAAQRYGCES